MRGYTVRRYEQLETSPETIEQELRPAVCANTDRQTDRLKENYSIDCFGVSHNYEGCPLMQRACVMQNVRYIRDVRAVAKAKGPTVDEVCTLWHVRINKPSMMRHFERTTIKDVYVARHMPFL